MFLAFCPLVLVACSLADIMAKAQDLQEQRDMLLVQLSLAEEEKAAAAHAAAIADAEAQWHVKMCQMLEVRPFRISHRRLMHASGCSTGWNLRQAIG